MTLATDVPDPDATLWVRFFHKSVQNNFRTSTEGHPCFDDKVFISIIAPGDPNNKPERPITEADKQRFPRQWLNFERGQSEKVDGMPVEEWPLITRAQAEELKYLGVRSIEQLVAASDSQMQKIMGGPSLRERARAFLASAKDTAKAQQLADENRILNDRIKALEQQLATLSARFSGGAALAAPPDSVAAPVAARPRGRPRKIQAA
jgi:nucleotidyltransferase/DNA polymerase involved in DNA repair